MWLLLVAVACRGAWATHPAPASCHDLCLLSLCHSFIATDHAPASFPIRAWLFSNSSARKPQLPPTNSTGNTVCVAQVSLSKQDIKPHAQHLCRSPRIVPGIVRHLEHIGIHKPSRTCGTKRTGIHKTKHCEAQWGSYKQCNVRPKDHLGTHKLRHCEACVCSTCGLAISSAALLATQMECVAELRVKQPSRPSLSCICIKPLQSTSGSHCTLRAIGRPQNKALWGPRNALAPTRHAL